MSVFHKSFFLEKLFVFNEEMSPQYVAFKNTIHRDEQEICMKKFSKNQILNFVILKLYPKQNLNNQIFNGQAIK